MLHDTGISYGCLSGLTMALFPEAASFYRGMQRDTISPHDQENTVPVIRQEKLNIVCGQLVAEVAAILSDSIG